MSNIQTIKDALPSFAKDTRLNLDAVLRADRLGVAQTFGCAIASASYLGDPSLVETLVAEAKSREVEDDIIEDAKAAASIMSMNTIYYRFRDIMGSESSYNSMPAQLRMSRMGKPATTKANFELFSLSVAALAGCHMCVKAHEKSIRDHGLTVHDAHDSVRIAAVIKSASVTIRSNQTTELV